MSDASRGTQKKVDRWLDAIRDVEELKRQLRRAECEQTNAANDLGKHLAPDNLRDDEEIGIWVRYRHADGNEKLLTVARIRGDYMLRWRQ